MNIPIVISNYMTSDMRAVKMGGVLHVSPAMWERIKNRPADGLDIEILDLDRMRPDRVASSSLENREGDMPRIVKRPTTPLRESEDRPRRI